MRHLSAFHGAHQLRVFTIYPTQFNGCVFLPRFVMEEYIPSHNNPASAIACDSLAPDIEQHTSRRRAHIVTATAMRGHIVKM